MLAKKSKETTPGSASIPEKKAVVFGAWNRNSANQMTSTTSDKTQIETPMLFGEEEDFPSLDSAIKENPEKKQPVVLRYRLKSAYQQPIELETIGKGSNDEDEYYDEEEADSDYDNNEQN